MATSIICRWQTGIIAVLLFALPLGAQPQNIPDAPKPKPEICVSHVNPRIFWTGVSLLAASQAADAIVTRRGLDRGGSENNWLYGRHPSAGKQTAINLGGFLVQATVFHFTEKSSHRWIRWTGRLWMGTAIEEHARMAACGATAPSVQQYPGQRCHAISPI